MRIEINIIETLEYMINELKMVKDAENKKAYLNAISDLLLSITNQI